jgi:hypothetical protein
MGMNTTAGTLDIMTTSDGGVAAAPSFLMARVRTAKDRARSSAATISAAARQGAQPAKGRESSVTPVPSAHPRKPEAGAVGKATAAAIIKRALATDAETPLDRDALMALFETHAKDSAVLELLRPALPALLDTIIAGALIRGTQGFQDRMTVFRMLGLPWTQTASTKHDLAQSDDAFANRLVRAVSRVEGKVRHATVTVDVSYEDEDRQPATIEGESAYSPSSRPPDRSR